MLESDGSQINLKLIFLGNQNVGKSSILSRFVQDKFEESYNATIGLDYHSKQIMVEKQNIRLILYDTAGQEKFKSLLKMYMRDANIIFVVYDITNRDSFMKIDYWLEEVQETKKENTIIAIVGNKIDKDNERVISISEGEAYARSKGFIFNEISAKTGEGIKELFYNKLYSQISKFYCFKDDDKGEEIHKEVIKDLTRRNEDDQQSEKKRKRIKCC